MATQRCRRASLILVLVAGLLVGCDSETDVASDPSSGNPTSRPGTPEPRSTVTPPVFSECAESVGLVFEHFNGMSGEFYFCETVGPGVAVFDYDADGDLDVYIPQGHMLGERPLSAAVYPPATKPPLRDRLFRNELAESGELRFVDVTESAGIDSRGYGMGVAVGDYDADGHLDLYVTNFGPNLLLRNRGDGTFEDRTAESGLHDARWNTSASFVDYDRDGDLDLFVCGYVRFTLANHKECYAPTSARDYCGPLSYPPYPDRLYRNDGNGRFTDVSAVSQITQTFGSALGVICADFDGDDWVDLFVANDGLANQLWINQHDGTFKDEALFAGCAYNEDGVAEASMGVDAADSDGDGDLDLFMTHLDAETNTLYVNDGAGSFEDHSMESGLGVPSRSYTGFGTAWFDYDNDGWLDIFCANGAVKTIESLARQGDRYPLRQQDQLFRNTGQGRYRDVSAEAGPAFRETFVSRGAAFGDLDNDGDVDIVVANNSGPVRLLRNEVGSNQRWLGLRVIEADGRTAVGARITVALEEAEPLVRTVRRAASYCSSNDPRIIVGLEGRGSVETVRVRWIDGTEEQWTGLALRSYHDLRRGGGTVIRGR